MKRTPLTRKTPLRSREPKKKAGQLKRSPLKPISAKRVPIQKQYLAKRREFMAAHPVCECCGQAKPRDVHHKAGRGKYLLAVETWLAVCRSCHDEIHAHPAWAREMGYLV